MTPEETTEALNASRLRNGESFHFLIQISNDCCEALAEIEDPQAREFIHKKMMEIKRFIR